MAPKPRIPPQLKLRPFTVEEARAAGVSPTALRGRAWVRLDRGLYCWSGVVADAYTVLRAFQRLLPQSVFAGRTAAWLLGLDLSPADPMEIIVPPAGGMRSRRGLTVHRSELKPMDLMKVRGLNTTTPLRTLSDLCPRLTGAESLALVDAALRLRRVDRAALAGARSPLLRALAPIAEPAESPMESRLRWWMLRAGLPRPQVQPRLHDATGQFIGRADLYYPTARLVIEYDGGNHRDRLLEDDRRQNLLIGSGFTVLRFTADDVYNHPKTVVAQVRSALSAAAAASARRPGAAPR